MFYQRKERSLEQQQEICIEKSDSNNVSETKKPFELAQKNCMKEWKLILQSGNELYL